MAETPHGMDTVNETITVKGMEFSSQLGIGAAKWLERKTGKGIMAVAQELVRAGDALEVTKVALLLTALYIQAHPCVDPQQAEAAVDTLKFPDMMEVLGRVTPFDFEPKNSPKVETLTEAASTGQPSSTT